MAQCPFCHNALSSEPLACGNCGARKSRDYLGSSPTRAVIEIVACVVLIIVFLASGYASPDPKTLMGAKMIAAFFGMNAAVRLFLLVRGPEWHRPWFMQRARRG